MEVWQAVVIGIVQGFTEFLPISSSAHIVFSEHLLGVTQSGLRFTILVHFGTLLAVCIALWPRLALVVSGTIKGLGSLLRGRSPWADENFRWGVYIIVGSIPAGIIGLMFEDHIDRAFGEPRWAAGFLLLTGVILFITVLAKQTHGNVTLWRAIVIGCAQALAILPGISRSGSTIAAALYLGIERRKAAEFSFLLAMPVILGPAILTIGDLVTASGAESDSSGTLPLVVGTFAALISGVFAIRVLLKFVQQGRLSWFAYYCWVVGGLGLVFF